MPEPSPARIALAGFGAWGQMHARAIAAIETARLVAVYCHGPTSEAAAREALPGVPRFRDYGAMLAAGGFDVVDIVVPNDRHAAFAVAALEAGTDVFMEKPLGLSRAECDRVVEAAARSGRQVAVDHELRVSHQWGRIRALIAAGEIGRLTHQHFSLFRHPFRLGSGGWRHDPARVGSWSLEELVHFVDLVLWYAAENGPPARVFATGTRSGDLTETVSATLQWQDGSTAVLNQCLAGFEHHTLLEIAGTDGAVRTWWSGAFDRTTSPDFSLRVRRRGESAAEAINVPRSGEVFELEQNIRRALDGFRAGVLPISLAEARGAVLACLAVEESVATGRAVELAL